MKTPRITLKGETLAACNRILNQTPIESYTHIFSILLKRYEHDLIEATNDYFRSTRVLDNTPSLPDKVSLQPDKVLDKAPSLPNKVSLQPDKVLDKAPSLPDKVPLQPKKTARQQLMDFED
ncbi:MAG: hypothetical protein WBA07_32870 [Rivularia sp. (in: cyanobacteria)]